MVTSRLRSRCRKLGYETYFSLVSMNYRHELYARRNRTPGGEFRCYDLLNRHGDDPMLGDIDRECGSSDVVYDVGANVGIYALSLAVGCPERTVVAIEPAPDAVAQLRANVEVNDLGDRIPVANVGLGAERGEREFYVSTYPELSGFDRESATRWGADVSETVDVRVETLDALSRENPEPDVVKLDVEGSGPAVLSGGSETLSESRATLYVELHDEELGEDHVTEMRRLLDENGYLVENRGGYWRCVPG